jgi:hypothetical protein
LNSELCHYRPSDALPLWLVGSQSLNPLEQNRYSHASANAQSGQTAIRRPPFHLVKQCRRDPHAGAADRMPKSDRATVNVQSIMIKLQITIAGDYLRCKCFIEFDDIDIVKRKVLPF